MRHYDHGGDFGRRQPEPGSRVVCGGAGDGKRFRCIPGWRPRPLRGLQIADKLTVPDGFRWSTPQGRVRFRFIRDAAGRRDDLVEHRVPVGADRPSPCPDGHPAAGDSKWQSGSLDARS